MITATFTYGTTKEQLIARGHDPRSCKKENTTRMIAKCQVCKKAYSHLVHEDATLYNRDYKNRITPTRGHIMSEPCMDRCCGTSLRYRPVTGHYDPFHKCDPRCLNAVGPTCDCECGGLNHGGNHQR